MTCQQFVAALSATPRADSFAASLREHAARCSGCQALWRADQSLRVAPGASLSIELPEALQRALREHRGPTRASQPWARLGAVLAACGLGLFVALFVLPRPDLQIALEAQVLPTFVALALQLLCTLWLFLYRGPSGLGARPGLRWLAVGLNLAGFHALCTLQSHGLLLAPAATLFATPRDCLLLGLLVAAAVFVTTFSVSRHSALIAPAASGALAGASAGLASLLFLQLHCPSQAALHLHVIHALPLALAVGAGALSGRRWLAA